MILNMPATLGLDAKRDEVILQVGSGLEGGGFELCFTKAQWTALLAMPPRDKRREPALPPVTVQVRQGSSL